MSVSVGLSIYLPVCLGLRCLYFINSKSSAKGILVVFKQGLNLPLLRTLDQPSERDTIPWPCGIGKQGRETNRSLWALSGLRPIRIISLHHRQEGGSEKRSDRNEKMRKRRSDWEDESGSDIKTGIECGAKGDVRRDQDHSNPSKCACVYECVLVCIKAHGAPPFLCVCD